MSMDLSEYKKAVEIMALSKSPLIFKNLDHQHASIVISTIMKHSDDAVFIYDTDLSGDIALLRDEIQTEIENLLKNKKKLKIVVQKETPNNSFQEFLKDLLAKYPEQLDVRLAGKDFIEAIVKEYSLNFNFTVGDNNKFRIEHNEPGKRKAICSFNNQEYGVALSELFTTHFNSCNLYPFAA
jgi:hypothetical protein